MSAIAVLPPNETVITDVDGVVFASVEDGRIFIVSSASIPDTNADIAPVLDIVRSVGLVEVSNVVEESVMFDGGVERRRWFA